MGQRFFLHSPESDTWDRKGLKLIWVRIIFIFFMSLPFSQIRFILSYFSPYRRSLPQVWKDRQTLVKYSMFSSISRGVWEGGGYDLRFSDISRRFLGSACSIPCHSKVSYQSLSLFFPPPSHSTPHSLPTVSGAGWWSVSLASRISHDHW